VGREGGRCDDQPPRHLERGIVAPVERSRDRCGRPLLDGLRLGSWREDRRNEVSPAGVRISTKVRGQEQKQA
jgi:hypothetical protein